LKINSIFNFHLINLSDLIWRNFLDHSWFHPASFLFTSCLQTHKCM